MAEKMKKENEASEKLKKANTELSVARAAAQSAVSDLDDRVTSLTEDRNLLEREAAKLHSQLQLERNQASEGAARLREVERELQSHEKDLAAARGKEQEAARTNAELSSRLAEMEKAKTSLESELRVAGQRHEQLVRSQQQQGANARLNNRHQEQASMEQVKSEHLPCHGQSMYVFSCCPFCRFGVQAQRREAGEAAGGVGQAGQGARALHAVR